MRFTCLALGTIISISGCGADRYEEPQASARQSSGGQVELPAGFGLSLRGAGAATISGQRSSHSNDVGLYPGETQELRKLINHWADHYAVPRSLVHRVVQRESDYRPGARNGPYYGLMQILPETAGTMGFSGSPSQLLDASTNLKYAVKYLRGAWLLSHGDEATAVSWYARGYYYEARNRCMLRETGLRATEVRAHCG